MYNLFVSYDVGKWDKSYFTYTLDRVFEHTAASIKQKYRKFDTPTIDEIRSFPSLFAYESYRNVDARIGWINDIQLVSNSVIIEHEFDPAFIPISASTLSELGNKLDIQTGEMSRTHWAIKNSDLFSTLFEAGIIKQKGPRRLRVFLCHASDDKAKVDKLYKRLVRDGIDAWFNEKSLLPGQDWELEIQEAIRDSDAILICLSSSSTKKEGYVQKEVKMALSIADEKPERIIFAIPVRLEDCQVPQNLRRFHRADLYLDEGYGNLYAALKERATKLGIRFTQKHLA